MTQPETMNLNYYLHDNRPGIRVPSAEDTVLLAIPPDLPQVFAGDELPTHWNGHRMVACEYGNSGTLRPAQITVNNIEYELHGCEVRPYHNGRLMVVLWAGDLRRTKNHDLPTDNARRKVADMIQAAINGMPETEKRQWMEWCEIAAAADAALYWASESMRSTNLGYQLDRARKYAERARNLLDDLNDDYAEDNPFQDLIATIDHLGAAQRRSLALLEDIRDLTRHS